jgi:hypothetical protein
MKRLVYICDWLPPDFGAVGQYAMLFSRQWAEEGWAVTLVGLTTGAGKLEPIQAVGNGSLQIIRVHRASYSKQKFVARLSWTLVSNLALLRAAFRPMRAADAVLFTGSPPLMLHFIAPLNLLLRKRLIYRITDFHPECLIAERGRGGLLISALLKLTQFWRRHIDSFEVLGLDQARRLGEGGIAAERIYLKRDPSPVGFPPGVEPLPLPEPLRGHSGVILYSGNWGVAHDENTFIEGYSHYFRSSARPLAFWLNATGAKADRVAEALRLLEIPFHRSKLVPLAEVPRLLSTVDIHLITLRDSFVGYVLPSKVHACIESGKRVLFIGSAESDVHLLADKALGPAKYQRIDVGDVQGLGRAFHELERAVVIERNKNGTESNINSGKVEGHTVIPLPSQQLRALRQFGSN